MAAKKKKSRAKKPRTIAEPAADAPVHADRSNNELRVGDLISIPCIIRSLSVDGSSSGETIGCEPQLDGESFIYISVHHKQVDLISRGL